MKWQVFGGTCLLITLLVVIFHIFRDVSVVNSILGWFLANSLSGLVIHFSFQRMKYYQVQLNQKIDELEAKAQRDAALAKLSGNLAASLDETEVCQELVERLRSVQGYDYVAVFTIHPETGNRILKAEVASKDLRPTPILQPGKGLSERPILDGELHYTPDITQEPDHVPGLLSGSEIDVPIQYDGEVMGVIVVESQQINAFCKRDLEMLLLAADQAALALKNARLLLNEKNRRQHAEILQRATTTLTSALDLNKVLEEILEQLRQVVVHDSATIFIWEGDTIHAIAARGLPKMDEVVGHRFPATDELSWLVRSNQTPVILTNVSSDPRFKGWGGTHNIRNWMGVPLITNDNVIGYLTLDSHEATPYNESQANLAVIFASQAAVAIENARLYRKAKDSSDRQAVLHKVSQQIIRAGIDLEQIYSSVHHAVAQLMPADSFVISILDEHRNEIEAVYLFDQGNREPSRFIPREKGLSGYVINSGKPLLAFDYQKQKILQGVEVIHFGNQEEVRSLLAVPMTLGERVIGMVSTQTYHPYDYSNQDQKLLEMLAAYAAIAIHNAQLFSEVQHLAITDSLTGAYNRRHFFDVTQREINRAHRSGQPITVMMIDLDFFKDVNDVYGHDIGDQALKLIVQELSRKIRNTDVLARYGGDEFVILLPETQMTQGQEIAERLRSFFEENTLNVNGILAKISLSIGLSSAVESPPQISVLLKCADTALYQAKKSGKNCIKLQVCPSGEQTPEISPKEKPND